MFSISKTKKLYFSVSSATDAVANTSRMETGFRNKLRAAVAVSAGFAGMTAVQIAHAQTDTMASVATEGKRFANLAITGLSVLILVAAVLVVIAKVFAVVSGRSTWGDVMAALIVSAFIAVIAGVILTAAGTAAQSIAA